MNRRGRPVIHGLKVITGDRVRRARIALSMGKTNKEVADKIFNLSTRTLMRYAEGDDIRSRILKRAINEGEVLRNEPLGTFICYLLDKRDDLLVKRSGYGYQLPQDEAEVDLDALEIKEKDEEEYMRLSESLRECEERIRRALKDSKELREYQESALKVRTATLGLKKLQQELCSGSSFV